MATPKLLATVIITVLALTCQGRNVLRSGQRLNVGQSLDEGSFSFKMQITCNLVLYDGSRAIWTSNTGSNRRCYAAMQTDGNFVIYNTQNNAVVWSSNTWQGNRARNYILVLQDDRDVVIYGAGLWATGSNIRSVGGVVHTVANGTAGGGFTESQSVATTAVGKVAAAAP